MRTATNPSGWVKMTIIIGTFLCTLTATLVKAQTIEFDGGVGYSSVDMTSWAGDEPSEWGQMTSYYGLNILFPLSEKISIGGGVRHHYLFWYDIRYPFGNTTTTLTREVQATRIAANIRFNFNRLFIDVAPGLYLFEDFSDFSVTGSLGYNIRLTEKLALPLRISAGFIADAETSIIPITGGAGLSYRFK